MKRMSQNGTTAASMAENMGRVGLGYGIAIAVGILVLVSTIMLASYVCVRVHGRGMVPSGGTISAAAAGGRIVSDGGGRGGVGSGGGGTREESNGNGTPGEWVIGGLDEATLESYPKVVYGEKLQQQLKQEDASCSICLADYRQGELLRLLPDCHHAFHVPCIDAWLRLHASCPMCRTSPLPTPQSTPLSELIPLARQPLQSRYTTHH